MSCSRQQACMRKSGTVTNTFGDLQLVRKAGDRAGVKSDFEILVRLADAMGANIKALVPFGKGGVTADLGQTRGAQSGEADRHAVWLEANGMELRMSPFDPLALAGRDRAAGSRIQIGSREFVRRKSFVDRARGRVRICSALSSQRSRRRGSRARYSFHLRNARELQLRAP